MTGLEAIHMYINSVTTGKAKYKSLVMEKYVSRKVAAKKLLSLLWDHVKRKYALSI